MGTTIALDRNNPGAYANIGLNRYGFGAQDTFVEYVGAEDPIDFYRFTIPTGDPGDFFLNFEPQTAGGAVVELFSVANPATPLGTANVDGIITASNLAAGEYFIRVQQTPNSGTAYRMKYAVYPLDEAANTEADALQVSRDQDGNNDAGSNLNSLGLSNVETLQIPEPPDRSTVSRLNQFIAGVDEDFYRFDIEAGKRAFVGIKLQPTNGDADMILYRVRNSNDFIELDVSNNSGSDQEQIGGTFGPGTYLIKVVSPNPDLSTVYDLEVNAQAANGIPSITRDITPGFNSSAITNVVGLGDFAYFNDDSALWRSKGGLNPAEGGLLETTELVYGGFDGIERITAVDNALFIQATRDDATGTQLFYFDGSTDAEGNLNDPRLIDPQTLTNDVAGIVSGLNIVTSVAVGDLLYFVLQGEGQGQESLWRSDGTSTGTFEIQNAGDFTADSELVNVGGVLFYTADQIVNGAADRELWRILPDGPNGPSAPEYLNLFTRDSMKPRELTAIDITNDNVENPVLYFVGDAFVDPNSNQLDSFSDGRNFNVMRISDTTGTLVSNGLFDSNKLTVLTNFNNSELETAIIAPGSSWRMAAMGDSLYFTAVDGASPLANPPVQLYSVDSSLNPATLIASSDVENMQQLTVFNNRLYFVGTSTDPQANTGAELWYYDPSNSNFRLVRDINTTPGAGANITQIIAREGTDPALYFVADDGVNGVELWYSDGEVYDPNSSRFTVIAGKQIDPDFEIFSGSTTPPDEDPDDGQTPTPIVNSSSPQNLTMVNGRIFFTADNGTSSDPNVDNNGRELWSV